MCVCVCVCVCLCVYVCEVYVCVCVYVCMCVCVCVCVCYPHPYAPPRSSVANWLSRPSAGAAAASIPREVSGIMIARTHKHFEIGA